MVHPANSGRTYLAMSPHLFHDPVFLGSYGVGPGVDHPAGILDPLDGRQGAGVIHGDDQLVAAEIVARHLARPMTPHAETSERPGGPAPKGG